MHLRKIRRPRVGALSPDGSHPAVGEVPGLLGIAAFLGAKPSLVVEKVAGGRVYRKSMRAAGGCLAFSPDGKHLAVVECKVVRVRDLDGKRWEADCEGHAGAVEQLASSPDGKRLLSASGIDRTLRVRNNDPADPARSRRSRGAVLDPASASTPASPSTGTAGR